MKTYTIQSNPTGTRTIEVKESHLETLHQYSLLSDLLDSNGIVDEAVMQKLRLNVRSLLENTQEDAALLQLCREIIFHDNMKAFGLHQLILLYLDWQKNNANEAL